MGWVAAGPVLVRLDVAERVAAELAFAARVRPVPVPADLASRLSVQARDRAGGAARPGLPADPGGRAGGGQFGPPMPAMAAPLRRRPPAARRPSAAPPHADHPFAALAALRG